MCTSYLLRSVHACVRHDLCFESVSELYANKCCDVPCSIWCLCVWAARSSQHISLLRLCLGGLIPICVWAAQSSQHIFLLWLWLGALIPIWVWAANSSQYISLLWLWLISFWVWAAWSSQYISLLRLWVGCSIFIWVWAARSSQYISLPRLWLRCLISAWVCCICFLTSPRLVPSILHLWPWLHIELFVAICCT